MSKVGGGRSRKEGLWRGFTISLKGVPIVYYTNNSNRIRGRAQHGDKLRLLHYMGERTWKLHPTMANCSKLIKRVVRWVS